MLFATDMRNMYCNLLKHKGWEYCFAENDESELGNITSCTFLGINPACTLFTISEGDKVKCFQFSIRHYYNCSHLYGVCLTQ